MPLGLADDESNLIQVITWCRQVTNNYLDQCWPRFMSPQMTGLLINTHSAPTNAALLVILQRHLRIIKFTKRLIATLHSYKINITIYQKYKSTHQSRFHIKFVPLIYIFLENFRLFSHHISITHKPHLWGHPPHMTRTVSPAHSHFTIDSCTVSLYIPSKLPTVREGCCARDCQGLWFVLGIPNGHINQQRAAVYPDWPEPLSTHTLYFDKPITKWITSIITKRCFILFHTFDSPHRQ